VDFPATASLKLWTPLKGEKKSLVLVLAFRRLVADLPRKKGEPVSPFLTVNANRFPARFQSPLFGRALNRSSDRLPTSAM